MAFKDHIFAYDLFPQTMQFSMANDGVRSWPGLIVSLFVYVISIYYTYNRGDALINRLET